MLRLLGLLLVVWLVLTVIGAIVKGLFWLAVVGLLLFAVTAVLATVTGWLGGELVDRLGIGVAPDAGPDTPASFETGIRLRRSTASK